MPCAIDFTPFVMKTIQTATATSQTLLGNSQAFAERANTNIGTYVMSWPALLILQLHEVPVFQQFFVNNQEVVETALRLKTAASNLNATSSELITATRAPLTAALKHYTYTADLPSELSPPHNITLWFERIKAVAEAYQGNYEEYQSRQRRSHIGRSGSLTKLLNYDNETPQSSPRIVHF